MNARWGLFLNFFIFNSPARAAGYISLARRSRVSQLLHVNESWHTYKLVGPQVWKGHVSHVLHMNEPCHTHGQSHVWRIYIIPKDISCDSTLTATHTATNTATHCNTRHTKKRCHMSHHTLQHELHHTATHVIPRNHVAWINTRCNTHCNTLQHTATYCNTLQHTRYHGDLSHESIRVIPVDCRPLFMGYTALCQTDTISSASVSTSGISPDKATTDMSYRVVELGSWHASDVRLLITANRLSNVNYVLWLSIVWRTVTCVTHVIVTCDRHTCDLWNVIVTRQSNVFRKTHVSYRHVSSKDTCEVSTWSKDTRGHMSSVSLHMCLRSQRDQKTLDDTSHWDSACISSASLDMCRVIRKALVRCRHASSKETREVSTCVKHVMFDICVWLDQWHMSSVSLNVFDRKTHVTYRHASCKRHICSIDMRHRKTLDDTCQVFNSICVMEWLMWACVMK